jgi:hypothetical protein
MAPPPEFIASPIVLDPVGDGIIHAEYVSIAREVALIWPVSGIPYAGMCWS